MGHDLGATGTLGAIGLAAWMQGVPEQGSLPVWIEAGRPSRPYLQVGCDKILDALLVECLGPQHLVTLIALLALHLGPVRGEEGGT